MRQIDGPTAVNPKPTPYPINGPGWFNHANPREGGGVPTIVTSDFLNALQAEILSLLAYVGMSPDWTDNSQVLEAILALIKAGGGGQQQTSTGNTIFFAAADTGAANSITIAVSAITGTPAVGTTVAVYMANANTGATTINLNGLGKQPVVNLDGSQLFNNQLEPNAVSLFTLRGTTWYLLSPSFWQPPIKVAPTVDGSQNGGNIILEPYGSNPAALILNKAGKLHLNNTTNASTTEVNLDLATGQLNTQMVFCQPLGKYLTPGFNNSYTWVSNYGDIQKVYSFTIPQFTYQIMFQLTGGGGAGGACDYSHVGSGGGAGETLMVIWACQPGDTATITVGGQGQVQGILGGLAPASDQGGGAGYSTSVTLVTGGTTKVATAGGGSGGNSFLEYQNNPGGYGSLVGGVTASNSWLVSGGFGGDGIWNNGNQIGGTGGGSYWGPGGGAVDHSGYYAQQDQAGTNYPGPLNLSAQGHGPAYGAGGGGAYNFNGADSGAGGIGGTGIVLALW